jgi:hypothetical protein
LGQAHAFWQSWLFSWYQTLTSDDQPKPVDLIFVMAGRIARKHYGIELLRSGMAPRLVLSIERSEVSKMSKFGLEGFDELIALRDAPARSALFLLKMRSGGSVSANYRGAIPTGEAWDCGNLEEERRNRDDRQHRHSFAARRSPSRVFP